MSGELPLIHIRRFLYEPFGTYGKLQSGDFHCFTVELPWLGNCPWVSCVQPGLYLASRGWFSAAAPPYRDIELKNVPNRSAIEIHAANKPSELSGCIAPAESLVWSDGVICGTNSRTTLAYLIDSFCTQEVWVVIKGI